MNDTTDISALRESAKKINHRLDAVLGALSPFNPDESAHWDCEKLICDLISQLEAERQRANVAEIAAKSYKNIAEAGAKEIAALKGDQVPVTWPDMPFTFDELEHMHGATFANGYVRGWARKCESVTMKAPLYDRPAKAGRVAQ